MEFQKILIRFGELSLKGKNKMQFIRKLAKNIESSLHIKPEISFDRLFLPYSEENLDKLKNIFGIYSFSPVVECALDLAEIKKVALALANKNTYRSFKIKTHRANKNFPLTSQEVNIELGAFLLANLPNLQVKMSNPDLQIEVEIRDHKAFVFAERLKGLGGLPVGINGKVLHLISGGIDSPTAAFEMMKRGIHIDFLNFISPPHTNEKAIEKVEKLVKILVKYQGEAIIYQANFTDLMNLIGLTSRQEYKINLMRRSFYRIANQLALTKSYLGISNGENLGQVASQTLHSIQTINSQVSLPIYRPVLTRDKIEIINQAQNIGTYLISIIKAEETCELFAPKSPIIKPKEQVAFRLEKELDTLKQLEAENLAKIVTKVIN